MGCQAVGEAVLRTKSSATRSPVALRSRPRAQTHEPAYNSVAPHKTEP